MPKSLTAYYFRKDTAPVAAKFRTYINPDRQFVTSLRDPSNPHIFVSRLAYDNVVRVFSILPDAEQAYLREALQGRRAVPAGLHGNGKALSPTKIAILRDYVNGMKRRRERVYDVAGHPVPQSRMTPGVISPLMKGLAAPAAKHIADNIVVIEAARKQPLYLRYAFLHAGAHGAKVETHALSPLIPRMRSFLAILAR
jgi:hypothetical protein